MYYFSFVLSKYYFFYFDSGGADYSLIAPPHSYINAKVTFDKAYIVMNKTPYDVIQKGKKVTIKVI